MNHWQLAAWLLATALRAQEAATDAAGDAQLRDAEGFVRAGPGRPIVLPADHGSHPETRTEWWYLTGPLEGPQGERFGFQATWFRHALVNELPPGSSPLAVRDVLLFHGVLADMQTGERRFTEQASRAFAAWAHADTRRLDVSVFGQRVSDASGAGQAARLELAAGDWALELDLDLGASAPLLHGVEPGLSWKGLQAGQASWYYSLPAVPVQGRLLREGRPPLPVHGRAWMDHEFGSSQLAPEQEGWDWFSAVLDDGTELMLYQMRRVGGGRDVTSSGTLRRADGTRQHLSADDFAIETTGSWQSPRTQVSYPAGWRLRVASAALDVQVLPELADQELETPGTTGVTYWEGLCRIDGSHAGRPVHGDGYVELVGYGEPIAERFLGALGASEGRP